MNVLYLTMNPNRQSTTVPTEGWFRFLAERGLRPVLVSRESGAFQEWAAGRGVPTYADPLPDPSKWSPFRFARSLWRMRRIVRRHGIQLIHANEQNVYPVASYLARLCRLPIVVSVHCSMQRSYCEWAFGGHRGPDRIVFLSAGSQEVCRPGVAGVIPESRWRLLHNGLDLELFRPEELRRSRFRKQHFGPDAVACGVACATRPGKQLEHLFEAVGRLEETGVKVVVAGGPVAGDEEYAESLFATARAQLGERLLLLGHLDELKDFYNGLDVFVNTSREEACSISVIESLACGCPVLGYPSKSVDGQVLPGGGEIVPQDDVGALTEALRCWVRDRGALAERRQAARRRAEEAFDIRRLSDELFDEYQAVLDERRICIGKTSS